MSEEQQESKSSGGAWWNPFTWLSNAVRSPDMWFPGILLIGTLIVAGLAFFGDTFNKIFDGISDSLTGKKNDDPQTTPASDRQTTGDDRNLLEKARDKIIEFKDNVLSTLGLGGTQQAPEGKSNVIMLDVGHGGRIVTADGREFTQEDYDNLTLSQLRDGINNGSLRIDTEGFDAGAVSPINGMTEYEANLYQAVATADKLRDKGWDVSLFAQGGDGSTSLSNALRARVDHANEIGAAAMLSFHNNAGGGTGSEAFFGNGQNCAELAACTEQQFNNASITTRRVEHQSKTAVGDLGVFRGHNDPERALILYEGKFMDTAGDMAEIIDPQFLDEYSSAIANSVGQYAESKGYVYQPLQAPAPAQQQPAPAVEEEIYITESLVPSTVPNISPAATSLQK